MAKKRGNDAAKSGNSSSEKGEPASKKLKSNSVQEKTSSTEASETFHSEAVTNSGEKWNFKIVSWNINGLRAWLQNDGHSIIAKEDPDVICLQETKCSKDKIPEAALNVPGYKSYFMSAEKEGYAGVAVYSKVAPLSIAYGVSDGEHDKEGRAITLKFEDFYLVTAYVPNSGRGLVTLDKRLNWDAIFLKYLQELDKEKPVIMCGDLNVSHHEIDLANPKTNRKNAGFTQEERDGFTKLLEAGFVDSFRHFYPKKENAYTFWTYMRNARAKNVGWRLDYFVVSERFKESLCDSLIRSWVMGSDHCPITLLIHTKMARSS
ncbi:exodeoxyribonuclease isoform X2 [Hyalella azteca]|nr:exodeoxyribonuclease isoform X2 [Hyalella azteca]